MDLCCHRLFRHVWKALPPSRPCPQAECPELRNRKTEIIKKKSIPITPNGDLYLMPLKYCDDARLARVFNETWQSINIDYRQAIEKHWQALREDEVIGVCFPLIPLISAVEFNKISRAVLIS